MDFLFPENVGPFGDKTMYFCCTFSTDIAYLYHLRQCRDPARETVVGPNVLSCTYMWFLIRMTMFWQRLLLRS